MMAISASRRVSRPLFCPFGIDSCASKANRCAVLSMPSSKNMSDVIIVVKTSREKMGMSPSVLTCGNSNMRLGSSPRMASAKLSVESSSGVCGGVFCA